MSLHSYIGAITDGIENERKNIACELHDDTIQSLIVLNQHIQATEMTAPKQMKESLVKFQQLLQDSLDGLRLIISGLRLVYLEDLGLVAALEILMKEAKQTSNILFSFQCKGEEHRFSPWSYWAS